MRLNIFLISILVGANTVIPAFGNQSISNHSDFLKNSRILALQMITEAQKNIAENPVADTPFYYNLKYLYSYLKQASIVDGSHSGAVASTLYGVEIEVSPDFYKLPVEVSAGTLIHEAAHYGFDSDECRAENTAAAVEMNSESSNGYLSIAYVRRCPLLRPLICGAPIILPQSKNDPVVFFRANHWIGGNGNCSHEYVGDINQHYQVSLDDFLNGRVSKTLKDILSGRSSSPTE